MRVFVTGATGFIGSAVVKDLIAAGHQVIGLSRSAEKAPALTAAGAEVIHGMVEEPERLKEGVDRSDGVIHLAFNHDFSKMAANCEDDRRVIATLGAFLAGSRRPLVVTSGTAIANLKPGELAKEDGPPISAKVHPRAASEEAAREAAARGVNTTVVRLPQVHDTARQGLISPAIALYRAKGVCAYLGDGSARWPAGHVSDVARLYRLAIERAEPNAIYHAVDEEGVPMRLIAEAIGRRLTLPVKSLSAEESQDFFGWMAMFAGRDMPASSARTRQELHWTPTGPGLIDETEILHEIAVRRHGLRAYSRAARFEIFHPDLRHQPLERLAEQTAAERAFHLRPAHAPVPG